MINEIINKIQESNSIGISFHTSPDGDSIGSALALMQILRKYNKDAYILCRESTPRTLNFLPYCNEITGENYIVPEDTDCLIVLDCGNVERINAEVDLNNRHYSIINIDHHLSNNKYGDINYVDTNASAVGEIVYDILEALHIELDKDIASCIYTSILTDTGSFKYPSTSLKTHTIAGKLVESGIDFTSIHRIIFDNKPYNKVKLYGEVISRMEIACNDKVSFMFLTKDMIDKLNLIDEDTSDVINFGTIIDTVEVTVFLKESKDGIKVGLRSKEYVDVRKIAEKFGGGGHIRAAGFLVYMTMEDIKSELQKILNKELM